MRIGAILIASALSAFCSGQAGTPESRWSIGLSGSVDHCWRILVNGAGDEIRASIINYRDEHETGRIGWSTGADATYALGDRWFLSSGLQFSDRGFRFRSESDLIATDPLDPELSSNHVRSEFTDHYKYLSIPLLVHRAFGQGRIRFEPGLGVWGDYLMSQYSIHANDFGSGARISRVEDKITDYRRIGASVCADLSFSLRLNEGWSLRLGPRGRMQMTSLAAAPILGYLWEAGLLAGVRYRFPQRK